MEKGFDEFHCNPINLRKRNTDTLFQMQEYCPTILHNLYREAYNSLLLNMYIALEIYYFLTLEK